MIKVKIGRHHIHRDINQPNPLELALEDNGFENIEVEIYFNTPPLLFPWNSTQPRLGIMDQRHALHHEPRPPRLYWQLVHRTRKPKQASRTAD